MHVRHLARTLGLTACLLAATACGSFWHIADTDGTLEDTMLTYAKLVRWGELERASLFVDEELRGDFVALSPGLERLHFTDFDLGPVEFAEEGAEVTVVYHVYDVTTLVERRIVERQRWTAGGPTRWTVRPDLSGFQTALGREHSG